MYVSEARSPFLPICVCLGLTGRDAGTVFGQALSHPTGGYYTTKQNVFGAAGDFITSPDVSALFGEMLAVW